MRLTPGKSYALVNNTVLYASSYSPSMGSDYGVGETRTVPAGTVVKFIWVVGGLHNPRDVCLAFTTPDGRMGVNRFNLDTDFNVAPLLP